MSDFRDAWRALRGRPGFTAAAMLTLALCIGITTAMFSVVDGIVLRPLAFPNANRLITLCEQYPGAGGWCGISTPDASDIAERARTIEALGFGRQWYYQLATAEGGVGLDAGLASPGLFDALGIRPEIGRAIEPGDLTGQPGTVAVVSHAFWQTRLGGARDVIGKSITLDKRPVTIVGVMPPAFRVPLFEDVELWLPPHIDVRSEQNRDWRGFVAYGRLRPGASVDAARAELAGIAAQLKRDHFANTQGWGIRLETLHDLVVGDTGPVLLLFLGAVFVVLLIGCANVANLLLARASARRREVALRAALGAGRGRLVRAMLVESFVLALGGTALGTLLAMWGIRAFRALAPAGIPRLSEVALDGTALLFALALAVGTTLIFGLAPALMSARVELAQTLRETGRGQTAHGGRLGMLLVVGELALAALLMSGAGLLTRSFVAYVSWRPGFEQSHLLTFSLFASDGTYPNERAVAGLWQRAGAELRAVPGVTAVGSASAGPLFGGTETEEVTAADGVADVRGLSVHWFDASPGYFGTLGVPIVRGRDLDERDVPGGPPVAVANEALVRQLWPGQNPIGRHLTINRYGPFEIVGVVRDVPPLRPGAPADPQLTWSNRQFARWGTFFVVRATSDPAALMGSLRARLRAIDPDLTPGAAQTMRERLAARLVEPRFTMALLAVFGVAALALAAVGTYGLLAYLVGQRARDIGIRLALGAQRSQVVWLVLRRGLGLAAAGLAVGLVAARFLTRFIVHLLAGVSPGDPVTLGATVLVLLVVAAAACLIPALRASRVDPMRTLRAD